MYGLEHVKEFIAGKAGVGFHPTKEETPTVSAAAAALGVREEQIIKSLVFLVEGKPFLAIANGNRRVSYKKLAALLGVGRRQVKLAPRELTRELTGYEGGVMPPFAHKEKLSTLVDRAVLDQELVYGGTGHPRVLLSIQPEELVRVTGGRVVDIT
ncbi:MAG: YbaK/EbsC family protein [bacterium]|nr:YbaK/EbsC family protein [Bacillota bacterium]HHW54440.1 YbaK/EbsC family protein [Bacillota bacterium]